MHKDDGIGNRELSRDDGRVVIGTRGSKLALWQAEYVACLLREALPGRSVEIEVIHTTGDRDCTVALSRLGGKGVFTKELEEALFEHRIDVCVHSMKDVPTTLPQGLAIVATPPRADVRDALVAAPGKGVSIEDLPQGARVGTCSLRRRAQLQSLRPDLELLDLRGNLDTRMGKAESGKLDAVIIACAGIDRMGWGERITARLSPTQMLPAVAQGIIGIEAREEDVTLCATLQTINDATAYRDACAERLIMRELEGGCQIPIAAWAREERGGYVIDAQVASIDGSRIVRSHQEGEAPDSLGLALQAVKDLLAHGAGEILAQVRATLAKSEVSEDALMAPPRPSSSSRTHLPFSVAASMDKVYLIGAGPGDPGLLTVRGREVLEHADVIIYDYLSNRRLLEYARPDAELIFVGKKGFSEHVTQDQINALLVDKALDARGEPRCVARLKGGDPFVFGRGGEEALALRVAHLTYEVVPGVTSAIAAPAYAGIPVTHRGYASSMAIITGNEDPGKEESSIDWEHIAHGADTLCFVMGIKNLPRIAERLMACGRAATTPVALVRWGTTPEQEVLTATLETVVDRAAAVRFAAPAIIVVGEVAGLRERLSWYEEARPLLGKRIWITRSRSQASDLAARLFALGARTEEIPTIAIAPVADDGPLLRAVSGVASYDWVVFTSVNGVDAFFGALRGANRDARAIGGARVAAIGPATARRLARNGIRADLLPTAYKAEEALGALLAAGAGEGKRILIPRAEVAREVLPDGLRAAGATVDVVAAYETVPAVDAQAVGAAARALHDGDFPAVTFTSSSTVRNFVSLVGERLLEDPHCRSSEARGVEDTAAQAVSQAFARCDTKVFSIGPITSQTASDQGLTVAAEAEEYTIPGLVRTIYDYYAC